VTVPRPHAAFLARALPRLADDPRVLGVAAAGSYASGELDAFSDLDLVLGVEPDAVQPLASARRDLAASLGPLVAAFTGEHVGEPRVLICLYEGDAGDPPLHVDLKFVSLDDLGPRVDEPVVLWARDERFARALFAGEARWPAPDPQWLEDRF
jgi:predicted nucleotidyltransferase